MSGRRRTAIWTLTLLCLSSGAIAGQRYQLSYTHGSPEGASLELIEHQFDLKERIQQIERFIELYPNHSAVDYLLEQLQVIHLRAKLYGASISYGERLLKRHPLDIDAALRCLQAAEAARNQDLAQAWNQRIVALSEQILASEQPKDVPDALWRQDVETAKSYIAQRDYTQFTEAIQAKTNREKIARLEELLRANPKSPYVDQAWSHLANAYRAAGDPARTLQAAEMILAKHPNDPDALLLSAQVLLERRSNYPKILDYANRVIQGIAQMAKPQQYSDKEWEKRKNYYLGSAHLVIGNVFVNQNGFAMADKHLRQSLHYLKGAEQTQAAVYFYLGWANYHLEKYQEAAAFFKECLSFGGAYAEQAMRNLNIMRSQRRIQE